MYWCQEQVKVKAMFIYGLCNYYNPQMPGDLGKCNIGHDAFEKNLGTNQKSQCFKQKQIKLFEGLCIGF